jgi:hypothetical protein
MSEMLDRLAKALWLNAATCADKEALWGRLADFDREPYYSAARAALSELLEPTEDVIEAGARRLKPDLDWSSEEDSNLFVARHAARHTASRCYGSMIAAAQVEE